MVSGHQLEPSVREGGRDPDRDSRIWRPPAGAKCRFFDSRGKGKKGGMGLQRTSDAEIAQPGQCRGFGTRARKKGEEREKTNHRLLIPVKRTRVRGEIPSWREQRGGKRGGEPPVFNQNRSPGTRTAPVTCTGNRHWLTPEEKGGGRKKGNRSASLHSSQLGGW